MYVTALVLAGGASRRMGRNKLALPVRKNSDESILQYVVQTTAAVAREVRVLLPPQADSTWAHSDIVTVLDESFYEGPLAALAHGWPEPEATETEHAVLVVAGDYPGLKAEVLAACIRTLETAAFNDCLGAVVKRDGILQPLIGCYHQRAGEVFRSVAAAGGQRLMPAVAQLHVLTLDAAEQGWPDWWTRPVHTPGEYEAWLTANGD